MTHWEPQTESALFDGLVPDGVDTAYGKLLEADRIPVPDAPGALVGERIVGELTGLGMAHVEQESAAVPPDLVANSPALALEGVMAVHSARITRCIGVLRTAHERAAAAHGRHCDGHGDPRHTVRTYRDPREIVRVSASLVNTARRDWMTLYSAPRDTPAGDASIIEPPPEAAPGIRRRAVYDQATVDSPGGLRLVRKCAARGEEIRILPRIRMKMQLADATAALCALSATGMTGAVLIHSPAFAEAMREYFELQWERAVPLGQNADRRASPLTARQQQVLDLLARGRKDDRIARELGIALSSVRRRAHEICEHLGADTRIQAAVLAQARGWINWTATQ